MGIVTDHGHPGANPPAGDETVSNIRVGLRERFRRRLGIAFEEEDRAIDRIGKRTAEHKFAPGMGRAGV